MKQSNWQAAENILRQALKIVVDSQALPMMLFGLTAFAEIRAAEGQKAEALAYVTQVLQYPRSFIAFAEEKAKTLQQQLVIDLSPTEAEAAEEQGRSLNLDLVLQNLIQGA